MHQYFAIPDSNFGEKFFLFFSLFIKNQIQKCIIKLLKQLRELKTIRMQCENRLKKMLFIKINF